MFGIGEGIDGRNAAVIGECLYKALRTGADDGTVDHTAHDTGGVPDWLSAPELEIAGSEKHDGAAELTHPHLETDAGARRGFGEDHGPCLTGERLRFMGATLGFQLLGQSDQRLDVGCR